MPGPSPIKVKVIAGSIRQGRFGDKPAYWIYEEAKKVKEMEAELLDLKDFPMPFFTDPVPPARNPGTYSNEVVKRWADRINDGDGFIIVTPEYNHGYPGSLKNALDSIFPEWNKKPVGFVGYGNTGGARSIEQLREVAVELQMTPIRNGIHIPVDVYRAVVNEKVPVNPELFKSLKEPVDRVNLFFEELLWWAKALKTARESDTR